MDSSAPLQALLVEDSEDDEVMVRRLISGSDLNLQLLVEHNGDDAMQLLHSRLESAPDGSELPRFILLDLSLPRLGGIEVLRRIKADPDLRDIPVIILSGSENEEEIRLGQDLKAHTHIMKPMSSAELGWIVKSVQNFWPRLEKLRLLE